MGDLEKLKERLWTVLKLVMEESDEEERDSRIYGRENNGLRITRKIYE